MRTNSVDLLEKMILRNTIALNVEVKDWKEAVQVSGNLLLNNGSIEKRYIDAMIEAVNTLGPYIVIAPGVALPHARPDDGVLEPCMSLVTLKSPVNFGNSINNPVKLVVSFGTVNNKDHISALSKLAKILGNKDKLDSLMNAQKIEDVEKILLNHKNE